MSIQERYDEIVALSGLSEQIVRRVFKATKQSLAKSLRQGNRATLPGVCTIYPEIRSKIDLGGKSSTPYIKLKAKPSSALETEFNSIKQFETKESEDQEVVTVQLNLRNPELHRYDRDKTGVRTTQINALL